MSSANTSIIESEDIHSHKKSTCLELLTELEKVIFSLTKENLNLTVQKIIKLFDTNFPYTFNTIICNLVYSAFSSQRNSFDIYINLLSMIQTKEEEINQNIIKIISIFIKCISKTKTHEAYNIISRLIEQNLIDANITKNIKSKYFAHYKEEYKKQTNGYEFHRIYPFKKPFGDPIERYFMDHYEELSKNDWELHKKYIKEGHNPNEIAKIIRNDEIEKLQEISSQTKFNINQTIDPSLYEICSFINKPNVTLIDYAAFFGAIQCFKYLLMNGAKLENTAKYAVAGGNLEIIHLCEQNHSSFEDAYETAIEFHRNDIFHYIYENKLEKINHGEPHPMPNNLIFGNGMQFNNNNNNYDNDINILVRFCIQKENYEILTFLEGKKMKIDNNVINESAKSGNLYLVKYFQQNYQLPNNVLVFATYSENIELIKYILEHKGFNINANTIHFINIWFIFSIYN